MALKSFMAAGLTLVVLTAPALADPASGTGSAPTTKTKTGDPNRMVCRKVESVGSRLAASKICRTAAEWEAQRAADRQQIEQSQTMNWHGNTAG